MIKLRDELRLALGAAGMAFAIAFVAAALTGCAGSSAGPDLVSKRPDCLNEGVYYCESRVGEVECQCARRSTVDAWMDTLGPATLW